MKCTVTHHSLVGPLPGASIVVVEIASLVSSQGRARQPLLTTRVVLSQGLEPAITHDVHPQPETRLKTTCGGTLGQPQYTTRVFLPTVGPPGCREQGAINWVDAPGDWRAVVSVGGNEFAGARPAEELNWVLTSCYLYFDRIDVKFPTESLRWVGLPVRRVPVALAQAQFANDRVPRKAGFSERSHGLWRSLDNITLSARITISTASSTP
ncbi:hypothetical protein MYCTH_89278 [Thermothelomyces thermophilus ATCC 42464]|uniref:Uncharacterized protein n=1 Tax=Thermothelomyces thermophilus (strain ATCC 42464 / BCRC 31852 / DSM 1799) TaxID=573729 RepID=G2Q067_THET4|nr:uncharacterized protein MYCTH_89278 [Thermothelomyces thermophilus ATCC 42464]AEO55741.1 hypothetical protein MYCTH_89278 [Thermothelomyces thermophilus ATCC 42464]